MNRVVTRPTGGDGLPHLFAGKSLLKPSVFVTFPRDQMVFRRPILEHSQAKRTLAPPQFRDLLVGLLTLCGLIGCGMRSRVHF